MRFLCCFILLGGAWLSHGFGQAFHPSDSLKCCLFKNEAVKDCCPLLIGGRDTVRIPSDLYETNASFSASLRLPENEIQLRIDGKVIVDESSLWIDYNRELLFEACCEYEQYIVVFEKTSGKRKFEGRFNGEHFIGYYKEYYKNGNAKCAGEYGRVNYLPIGTWIYYKKSGGIKKIKQY